MDAEFISNAALLRLPLFATDLEIATAIVGKIKAPRWMKERMPHMEKYGFPKVDPVHDGRPVALVRKFYEGYLGLANTGIGVQPAVEGEWRGRKRKSDDDQPQPAQQSRPS